MKDFLFYAPTEERWARHHEEADEPEHTQAGEDAASRAAPRGDTAPLRQVRLQATKYSKPVVTHLQHNVPCHKYGSNKK